MSSSNLQEPRRVVAKNHGSLLVREAGQLAAAVQLVRFQLGVNRDYYFAGTWTRHVGKLAVSTPIGVVLARSHWDGVRFGVDPRR